jgi:pyruvate/2-oxoglutarate dehydrogenase complex dihydrolipoamide acyltransferase (E2) component
VTQFPAVYDSLTPNNAVDGNVAALEVATAEAATAEAATAEAATAEAATAEAATAEAATAEAATAEADDSRLRRKLCCFHKGNFHDQGGDAKWIVIRRQLMGHNDTPLRAASPRPANQLSGVWPPFGCIWCFF